MKKILKMKSKSKIKKDKFINPYKIFDINNKPLLKRKINTSKKLLHTHSGLSPESEKKVKELALSNIKFSNYMNSYDKLTKENCFKTPGNTSYPIRRNLKFTPISLTYREKGEEDQKKKNYLYKKFGTKENLFSFTNNFINSANSKNFFNNFSEESLNIEGNIEETPYGFKYKDTKIITDINKYRNNNKHFSIDNNKRIKNNKDNNIKFSINLKKNRNNYYKNLKNYKSNLSRNKRNELEKKKNDFFTSLTDGVFFESFNKTTSNIYNSNKEIKTKNLKTEEYIPYDLQYSKNTNKDIMAKKEKNILFLLDEVKDLPNNINNNLYHKKMEFNIKSEFKKSMKINLEIKSICLEFIEINLKEENDINLNINKQKLYLPFNFIPLFYILDFVSFKCFISEAITYDTIKNVFMLNNNIFRILKKYTENAEFYYKNYSIIKDKNKINIFKEITYNENEYKFKTDYDWCIYNKNDMTNNKIYKMNIIFPIIKFNLDEYKIKIRKFINKDLMTELLKKNFYDWNKLILFDLFIIKKFRLIINNILLHKYDIYSYKKIILDKNQSENKKLYNKNNYDFYITNIKANITNYFYFIPNTIIMTYLLETKEFKARIIQLSIKDTNNLRKLSKYIGLHNLITKCIFINRETNKISLKMDLYENMSKDLIKLLEMEKEKLKKINEKKSKINNDKDKDVIKCKIDEKEVNIILREPKIINFQNTRGKIELLYCDIPEKLLEDILNENNSDHAKCLYYCVNDVILNLKNFDINSKINWNKFIKENIYLTLKIRETKEKIRNTVIEKNLNIKKELLIKKVNKRINAARIGARLLNEWRNNNKLSKNKISDRISTEINVRKFSLIMKNKFGKK